MCPIKAFLNAGFLFKYELNFINKTVYLNKIDKKCNNFFGCAHPIFSRKILIRSIKWFSVIQDRIRIQV